MGKTLLESRNLITFASDNGCSGSLKRIFIQLNNMKLTIKSVLSAICAVAIMAGMFSATVETAYAQST
jgi:hypothetical protein